jgi:2-alkenal reductase
VDVVNEIVPVLITKGKVPRPGIGIVVLDEETAAGLGVVGVVIDKVMPGSEADKAGLKGIDYYNRVLGDVIIAVEDQDVANIVEFVRLLQTFSIGQTVTMGIRRGDQKRRVNVLIMDIS